MPWRIVRMLLLSSGLLLALPSLMVGQGALAHDSAKPLTVAAVSCESRIRDVSFNLARIEDWSRRAARAGAELVLFPECAISGWWQSRENRRTAEPVDGASVQRLVRLAGELGIILAVGLTERDGPDAYITHLLLDGTGVLGKHRKSALAGGADGEGRVWQKGNDANVFKIRGHTVGIAICFESVHPETCAALTAKGATIILAPYANGTDPNEITDPMRRQRRWIWDRVKENQVWYVACDATPHNKDGSLRPGAAFIIDPQGQLVACTSTNAQGEAMVIHIIPVREKRSEPLPEQSAGRTHSP